MQKWKKHNKRTQKNKQIYTPDEEKTRQKKSMRIIKCAEYDAHTNSLFKNMNLLKLNDLYCLKIGSIMHQVINNGLYRCIAERMETRSQVHSHVTRQSNNLNTPRYRCKKSQFSVLYVGINFWNELNSMIDTIIPLRKFKILLKRYYIGQY